MLQVARYRFQVQGHGFENWFNLLDSERYKRAKSISYLVDNPALNSFILHLVTCILKLVTCCFLAP